MVDPGINNQSRQKSCSACVHSKRRCDKQTPQCTRCAVKGLSCLYRTTASVPGNISAHVRDVDCESTPLAPGEPLIFPDGVFELGNLSTFGPAVPQERFTSGDIPPVNSQIPLFGPTLPFELPFSDLNSLTHHISSADQNPGTQPWHTLPIQDSISTAGLSRTPGLPPQTNHRSLVDESCNVSENFQPWRLYESDSKIHFITESIKGIPSGFARTTETPFLHRHLYRKNIPRSMTTLYAAVSVYAAHTDDNRDWALRVLTNGVDDLTATSKETGRCRHDHVTAQSHESANNPAAHAQAQSQTNIGAVADDNVYEKLARTQALWMYQVLRVFDGDIGLRAQAERDMATLEAWLLDLEQYRDNLAEISLLDDVEVRQRAPSSWDSWILNESLRRTVLMGYSFIAFYALLKWSGSKDIPMPDPGHFVRVHRWTASGPLWNADSSRTFFLAWHSHRQSFVRNFFIGDFARTARPVDVDPISWIMLAAFVGSEKMEQFMAGDAAPLSQSNTVSPR